MLGEKGERLAPSELVVWATGRDPLTVELGLQEIGVALDSAGHVVVDDFQATSVPGSTRWATSRAAGRSRPSPSRPGGACAIACSAE